MICDTYQHKSTGPGNCLLIQGNSSQNDEGDVLLSTENSIIYRKRSLFHYSFHFNVEIEFNVFKYVKHKFYFHNQHYAT